MDNAVIIFILAAVAVGVVLLIVSLKPKPLPYKKRNLLTKAEYKFWTILQKAATANKILICPKVRMEDFIEVTDYTKSRQSWRGRIKSRHIDFILCDMNLNILAGIELDDRTHQYNQRTIESDKLKNSVFEAIEVPLYHITVNESSYYVQIQEMLDDMRERELI